MKKIVLNLWCLNLELSIPLSIKTLHIKNAGLKTKLKKTLFEILENGVSYVDLSTDFENYIFQSFKTSGTISITRPQMSLIEYRYELECIWF